jgi:hypothetical protein
VTIEIESGDGQSNLIIEDDGAGMGRDDLAPFFDLGNSNKTDSIGHKGHGTKIYYKSDRITVETNGEDGPLKAVMDDPWETLNNGELPTYDVTKAINSVVGGTRIEIEGFRSGRGFDPESLTYNRIEHYLMWKTIVGSTAHYFDDDVHEMEVEVKLSDDIDDTEGFDPKTNRFKFPPEQHEPGEGEMPASRMCKVYGPNEFTFEYDGGTSSLQIVGMVGGKETRNELPTYGKHSAQFGVWLATDHIKIERVNEVVSHDNEFIHFFFVANCPDLELSANRGQIRNKASPLYEALIEEIDHYLSKVVADPWFKQYMEERRLGDSRRRANSQVETVQRRLNEFTSRNRTVPQNPTEVLLRLERSNANGVDPELAVVECDPDSEVPALIEDGSGVHPAGVSKRLSDHFEEDRPLDSLEKLVCWEIGERNVIDEIARTGYHGGELEADLDEGTLIYRNGSVTKIDIVEVRNRFRQSQ